MEELRPAGYHQQYDRQIDNTTFLADQLANRGIEAVTPTLPLVTAAVQPATIEALQADSWRLARTASGHLRIVCLM